MSKFGSGFLVIRLAFVVVRGVSVLLTHVDWFSDWCDLLFFNMILLELEAGLSSGAGDEECRRGPHDGS